jgi:hypothetical protein
MGALRGVRDLNLSEDGSAAMTKVNPNPAPGTPPSNIREILSDYQKSWYKAT